MTQTGLRGVRFAPSPTGVFHIGNLRTAWISHWWARALGEPWVVRFEDIDGPRVVPGAQERQLAELQSLGLEPDTIVVQSSRRERHWRCLLRAATEGLVYPCFCSRKEVADALDGAASAPHGATAIYSGRCRGLQEFPKTSHPSIAWRFRVEGQGHQDFIVARTAPLASLSELAGLASGFAPAYNWACAIDDIDGRYRLLVRAIDLASVAELQSAVQHMVLAWEERGSKALPALYHAALVVTDEGARLEKRTRGVTLAELEARGLCAKKLVALFERSFKAPRQPRVLAAGSVLSEPLEKLRLRDLFGGPF